MCFINTCAIHSADADADLPAPGPRLWATAAIASRISWAFPAVQRQSWSARPFNDVGLPQWLGKSDIYIYISSYIYIYIYNIKFGCTSYAMFNWFPGLDLDVSLCWRLWQLQHPPRDPGIPIRQACYRNNIILTTSADSQLGAERSGAWNVACTAWAHSIE